MPTLTIDGRSVTAEPGESVLRAALRLGIEIPHFCWHPYLSVAGNCRMCLVDIEKQPKLAISCSTPVAEGMVVRTDSEKVKDAVQGVLEFLLVNHPIDCPICDQAGECYLQDYYMTVGLHESRIDREDKVPKGKAIDLGPIVLDQERCVLCSRCVRYTSEVSGTGELYLHERGNRTEIRTFADRPLTGSYTGNLADVCPVGALTSRDFRFQKRVWFLRPVASVCQGCATGCSIWADRSDGIVHRLRPRDNPHVNKLWMCDPGRATYREIHAPGRVARAAVRQDGVVSAVPLTDALQAAARALAAGPGSVGLLLSARLSLEDLFAGMKLRDVLGAPPPACWLHPAQEDPSAREDEILRRRDPHPNTAGARRLDVVPAGGTGRAESEALLQGMRQGSIRTLLVAGADRLAETPLGAEILAELPRMSAVIALASHEGDLTAASTVVLPAALWAERDGTCVSGLGRIQRFRKAVEPPGEARPVFAILLSLLRLLGGHPPSREDEESARSVFRWITSEVATFAGLSYDSIGPLGVDLSLALQGSAPSAAGATR